jgi:UDP-glucose 4-epimerase
MIQNKKIFITGGAGFIGSTLIGKLIEHNHIVAYDNLARNALQGKAWKDHPNLQLVVGDVLDYAKLAQAMAGADVVVHCAAIAGIDTVVKNPVATMRVNMVGSANVLEALPSSNIATAWSVSPPRSVRTNAFRSSKWTRPRSARSAKPVDLRREQAGRRTLGNRLFPSTNGCRRGGAAVSTSYGPGQVGEGALRTFVQRALKERKNHDQRRRHADTAPGARGRTWCAARCCAWNIPRPSRILQHRQPARGHDVYGLANTVIPGAEFEVQESSSYTRTTPTSSWRIPNVAKARELIASKPKWNLDEGIRARPKAIAQIRGYEADDDCQTVGLTMGPLTTAQAGPRAFFAVAGRDRHRVPALANPSRTSNASPRSRRS